jgi:enediyne polyketide synthase
MSAPAVAGAPALALLGGEDAAALARQLDALVGAPDALADRARRLAASPPTDAPLRAALVATPATLGARAATLREWLADGDRAAPQLRHARGVFLGRAQRPPRLGFLLPGQGAPATADAGALGEAFPQVATVYAAARLPRELPPERVQQAVVAGSLAALRAADELGLAAELAIGHSLGELTALHWAGALGERALLGAAQARGEAMTLHASAAGAMASVVAETDVLAALLNGEDVVVACANTATQQVVSGPVAAVERVVRRARSAGVRAVRLPVVGAFHSPLVAPAVPVFARHLAELELAPLRRTVVSTVSGRALSPEEDLRALLARQIVAPVRFHEAVRAAAPHVDLFVELGPGRILGGLLREIDGAPPAVSSRAGEGTLDGLLEVAGAAHAAGVRVRAQRIAGGCASRGRAQAAVAG